MTNPRRDVVTRFWARVQQSTDCWLWTGTKRSSKPNEYGRFLHQRRWVQAHRFSYELANRVQIPADMTVDHLCGRKACVNPGHLEIVSRGENSARYALSRQACKHGHAWSTENTRITARGRRDCRTCNRERWRRKHGAHSL